MLYGDPRRGAALDAPTAPHATEAASPRKNPSGPARFWGGRRARIVFQASLLFSLIVHMWFSPWTLFSKPPDVELHDVDEELTIPIDLLAEEAPPEPPPPETVEAPPTVKDPNAPTATKPDAAVPQAIVDAAAPDADASALGEDAGAAAVTEDGGKAAGDAAVVAIETDAGGDAGAVAAADAGGSPGASGPRDPGSMIGMAGIVEAGQVNVTLLVNVAVIRTNPVGARLGPILKAIPQWNEFLRGSHATFDPIKETDWILVYGPSLIHTDKDAVIVRYSAPDQVIDKAISELAKSYDKGGPFDVGVPGVKASIGHADNAERVFLRLQPHTLVIVPKDSAKKFALALKSRPIAAKVRPGEAMRLTVKDPWKQISVRGLKFSQSLHEIRLWIVPRTDGGADVYGEGDTTDDGAAAQIADDLTQVLKQYNRMAFLGLTVSMMTRGLLDNARVVPEGAQVKLHVVANQAQLEAVLGLVAAATGANVAPPPPP